MACAGDGIQTEFVGFAVGVLTFGDDSDALAFDVLELRFTTGEIKGDVLDPTDTAFSNQRVVLGDGAEERRLGFVGIDRNVGVGLLLGAWKGRCGREKPSARNHGLSCCTSSSRVCIATLVLYPSIYPSSSTCAASNAGP